MPAVKLVDRASRGGFWRALLVAACVVAGMLALSSRLPGPQYDLQVVAPDEVRPGQYLPARAFVLSVQRNSIPQLEAVPLTMKLQGLASRELKTQLHPSACDDMEGALWIPPDVPERIYTLSVSGHTRDQTPLHVSKLLRVRDTPSPLVLEPRLAHATQQVQLGRLRVHGIEVKPSRFEVEIAQGSCLPEHECLLVVHTTLQHVTVHLEEGQGVTFPHGDGVHVQAGYAALALTVHGPVAHVTVVAKRDQTTVLSQPLQLPVALGQPSLNVAPGAEASAGRPHVKTSLGRCVILDAFKIDSHGEHWQRTLARPSRLIKEASWNPSWVPLEWGQWRLQARHSPFDTRSARSAIISVSNKKLQCDSKKSASNVATMFHQAAQEAQHVLLPEPVRSLPAEQAALLRKRGNVRAVVAVMTVLVGASLLVTFMLGGLKAQRQADRIWQSMDEDVAMAHRYQRWLAVGALALLATAAGLGAFLLLWIYTA